MELTTYENFETLNIEYLEKIDGGKSSGNIFKDIGWIVGQGIAGYCKGASLMYG